MPFRNVSRIEKPIIISSVIVLLFSFALLIVSIFQFGINVSNCVTNMTPFQKGEVITHDPGHYEIHYVAKMWSFEPAEVHVPLGAQVDIYLTSADVNHGFEIPGTGVNLMAVPGAVNYARVKLNQIGSHSVVCHEYCGAGHHAMAAQLIVEYPGLAPQNAQAPTGNAPSGLKIMQNKGCLACHSVDGSPGTGPTLKGVFGNPVALIDGSTVTADEAYLRESILEPQARIVKGFGPIMPKIPLSPDETDAVISYIKTVK